MIAMDHPVHHLAPQGGIAAPGSQASQFKSSQPEVPRYAPHDGPSPGSGGSVSLSGAPPSQGGSHGLPPNDGVHSGYYALSSSSAQSQHQQTSPSHYTPRPASASAPYHSPPVDYPSHAAAPQRAPHSPHSASDGIPPPYDSHGYGPGAGGAAGGGAGGVVAGPPSSHGQSSTLSSQVAPPRPPPSILESQSHASHHPASSHSQPPTPLTATPSHLDPYPSRAPSTGYYGSPAPTPQQQNFPYHTLPSPGHPSPTTPGVPPRMGMGSSLVSHHHHQPVPLRTQHYGNVPYAMGHGVLHNMGPGGQVPLVQGMVPHGYMHHGMYGHHGAQQLHQDRPFKCDQCQQSFNRNHDLKRHKRIHLAVKPFPCGNCDKSFSRKDALKRHRLVKNCGSDKADKSEERSQ